MNEETLLRENLKRGGCVLAEFKGHRRELFGNPYEYPFRLGDYAIVEADRGQDAGVVKHVLKWALMDRMDIPQYMVVRRAGSNDQEQLGKIDNFEKQATGVCRKYIDFHKLPMKVVDTEFRFDGLKLTFYFTADGRVDFRELVRDLAGKFRTRIELRQIGSRDEAKRCDSYGLCGCQLCCTSFLDSFQPITTIMAKTQNLILNPSKLSGLCGRLKCCLSFEVDQYGGEQRINGSDNTLPVDGSGGGIDEMSD